MAWRGALYGWHFFILALVFGYGDSLPQQLPLKNSNNPTSDLQNRPECAPEIEKYCNHRSHLTDFAILDCLLGEQERQSVQPSQPAVLSSDCQNTLHTFQLNFTTDPRVLQATKDVCKGWIQTTSDVCGLITPKGDGHLLSCLITQTVSKDRHANATTVGLPCWQFLQKMGRIVLRDYSFIYKFTEDCKGDITRYKCGRTTQDKAAKLHQGHTIDCLMKQWTEAKIVDSQQKEENNPLEEAALAGDRAGHSSLAPQCVEQMRHLVELQSNDYHLDVSLYYACHEDRAKDFCAKVSAGDGRVYKCLMANKFHADMSDVCRHQLTKRSQVAQKDIRANRAFMTACGEHLSKFKCLTSQATPESDFTMATAVLCLERAQRYDHELDGGCEHELGLVRASLINDWEVDLGIIAHCQLELNTTCAGKGKKGRTMHCLMGLARPSRHKFNPKESITDLCRVEVEKVMAQVDPVADTSMDMVLMSDCEEPITLCQDQRQTKQSGAQVMQCLMSMLGKGVLTGTCRERLLEIQYFVVRQYKLDRRLWKACKADSEALQCGSKLSRNERKEMGPGNDRHVLSCLYRNLREQRKDNEDKVSKPCAHEVERLMRERAEEIDLEPDVEDACMADLAEHCTGDMDQDARDGANALDCLENHFENLVEHCKEVVKEHLNWEEEDSTLDRILMKACEPSLDKYCAHQLERADEDNGEILQCLIQHKLETDMDPKCRAGIEHHQLTMAKTIMFSRKFKRACEDTVQKYCTEGSHRHRSRSETVVCLSEMVRNDTLLDAKVHRVSEACRKELRFELLTEVETVKLDRDLFEACRETLTNHGECADLKSAAEVLPCLVQHKAKLSPSCHQKVFNRQKIINAVVGMPLNLAKKCKRLAEESNCGDPMTEDGPKVLACLQRFLTRRRQSPGLLMNRWVECAEAIDRLEIQSSEDYRLNPSLVAACHKDIQQECSSVIDEHRRKHPGQVEMQGRVIKCLKKKYLDKKLSPMCASQIQLIIEGVDEDFRKDFQLSRECGTVVRDQCGQAPDKVECLREKLFTVTIEDKCRIEIVHLISESKVDVRSDIILYRHCAQDISRLCSDIPETSPERMNCLLEAREKGQIRNPKCRDILSSRLTLWQHAIKVAPPESLGELYSDVSSSANFSYFVTVFACIICVVMLSGVCCGRITKRVPTASKNK